MRALYLGTDSSRYTYKGELVHYPIIQTVPITDLDHETRIRCEQCTDWLFTSPNAVRHWYSLCPLSYGKKKVFAVGPATASALADRGVVAKQPYQATQEGIVELFETMDFKNSFIGWPKSSLSRPVLRDYFNGRGICYLEIELYTTVPQRVELLPNLDAFDEIVFTSPSTVRAFIEIFGQIPWEKKITPIGPITENELDKFFFHR